MVCSDESLKMRTQKKLIAFNTLVRPVLEYECPVWDPFLKKDIKILQKVQNEALRFIFSIKGPISFSQLRHDTIIFSLEERRKEIGRQLFFKSYAHSVDLNFIVPLKPVARTRQGEFYKPFIKSKHHVYSFWPCAFRDFGDGF